MQNPNCFRNVSDIEAIEQAIRERGADGIVVIPPRESDIEPERRHWLIDRAILLPENTTVILQNCTIQLSDRCRDNFFRTANCGFGFPDPQLIHNVHLRGEGRCVLRGADNPRATGDRTKTLKCPCPKKPEDIIREADWIPDEHRSLDKLTFREEHCCSYGTDAGNPEESQYGDWRSIGILFANVDNFSIEGLRMEDYHGWGVSLEACSNGYLSRLDFDAHMSREINGRLQNNENQDGINLRNGCHDIMLSEITGGTGDDLIALTTIADKRGLPGGSLVTNLVMHTDWSRRESDISNIQIHNVTGRSQGGVCWLIRLLPVDCRIRNVIIDGVIDNSPADNPSGGVFFLGEDGAYGTNPPDGMTGIIISNVICQSRTAITVAGYLRDSVISNVINRNPECPIINVIHKGGFENVMTHNLMSIGGGEIIHRCEQ